MQRSFLVLVVAFVALMAGALFYAARLPVAEQAPAPPSQTTTTSLVPSGPVNVAFELKDMTGAVRDFAEWSGEHRILNFWATWCAPCRREIPLLKAFQDQHRAEGIRVIGIAVDFPDPVVEYAKAAAFNYPILVGEQDAMAVAEASGVDFIGLPFTMFVDRQGELIGTHMGEIHQEQLEVVLSVLAQIDSGEIDNDTARSVLNSL